MRTVLVLVLAATVALAQAAPSFEVAAIRENTSGATGGSTRIQPGGRWIATNISLASLITVGQRFLAVRRQVLETREAS